LIVFTNMPEFAAYYPLIKQVHVATVTLSLLLFCIRWGGVLSSASWPMQPGVRHTSVGIDVVLLASGVTLWLVSGWPFLTSTWLQVKLGLLVVYILLGSWALKRAKSKAGHLFFGMTALTVVAQMVGVALMHHPGGWLQWVLRHAGI
jgi:uncharacterized membrane protein SirB2